MADQHDPAQAAFDPTAIKRPDPVLLRYYMVVALLAGPLYPIALLPLFFKYHTLEYQFDDNGISMRWGILFRREINLTYRRIQDIHLTRNLVQRWLGLATVAIQTASGSAGPEMSIEGVLCAEQLRDHLYEQMRGARGLDDADENETEGSGAPADEALELLREIRDAIRAQTSPHQETPQNPQLDARREEDTP